MHIVQQPNGRYRIATSLTAALKLARQIAKKTNGTAVIRKATVTAGDTQYYVSPDGRVQREQPRMKAFWE